MTLFENPFYILGATPRDTKQRIMELAREKSLTLDPDIVNEARDILINPRRRIAAEVAWLPMITDDKIEKIFTSIECNRVGFYMTQGLFTNQFFITKNHSENIKHKAYTGESL